MDNQYYSLERMLGMIDEPMRALCFQFLSVNREIMMKAPGSSNNHQIWEGGYLDHIQESMNISILFYGILHKLRQLPFSLSDALLVLFLHDIEKPWKYKREKTGSASEGQKFNVREERYKFRISKLAECGFQLTFTQENALRYIEGELDDYSPLRRVMEPLATFCHLADITSARIWFDHPLAGNDSWNGAKRCG